MCLFDLFLFCFVFGGFFWGVLFSGGYDSVRRK